MREHGGGIEEEMEKNAKNNYLESDKLNSLNLTTFEKFKVLSLLGYRTKYDNYIDFLYQSLGQPHVLFCMVLPDSVMNNGAES